jgi:hypothetical protein
MPIRINTAKRTATATAMVNGLTVLEIRTGTQPADANTAASGTLLATITVAWTTTNGVATVTGTPSATAVATGTAGWGRYRNTGDTERVDDAVGQGFTLSNTSIVSGGTVTLTSATITQPANA